MLAVTTADAAGVGGPLFLTGYGLCAALVAGWWLVDLLRTRATQPPHPPSGELGRRPQDVAMLDGGPGLTLSATLRTMSQRGQVTLTDDAVQAAELPDAGAGDLERAIHLASGRPLPRAALGAQLPVRAVLDAAEQRLVGSGLLVSGPDKARLRRIGLVMTAVGGLGAAGLLAAVVARGPVGPLAVELVVVLLAALAMVTQAPWRTRLGDRVLARTGADAPGPRSFADGLLAETLRAEGPFADRWLAAPATAGGPCRVRPPGPARR